MSPNYQAEIGVVSIMSNYQQEEPLYVVYKEGEGRVLYTVWYRPHIAYIHDLYRGFYHD